MIFFAAYIIWLGNKRGMQYWNWLIAYLFIASLSMAVRILHGDATLEVVTVVMAVLFLIAFHFWPRLVDDAHRQAMAEQAKQNADHESARADAYYQALADWLVVRSYVEASQLHELHADQDRLSRQGIASHVKTAGITTLSVHQDHFEAACQLLGIEPLEEIPVESEPR